MKRETILALLTKDKWELPDRCFEALVNVAEELRFQDLRFTPENIKDHLVPVMREETMSIIHTVGVDRIKDELIVRLMLKGYFEFDFFS